MQRTRSRIYETVTLTTNTRKEKSKTQAAVTTETISDSHAALQRIREFLQ